MLGDMWSSSE